MYISPIALPPPVAGLACLINWHAVFTHTSVGRTIGSVCMCVCVSVVRTQHVIAASSLSRRPSPARQKYTKFIVARDWAPFRPHGIGSSRRPQTLVDWGGGNAPQTVTLAASSTSVSPSPIGQRSRARGRWSAEISVRLPRKWRGRRRHGVYRPRICDWTTLLYIDGVCRLVERLIGSGVRHLSSVQGPTDGGSV